MKIEHLQSPDTKDIDFLTHKINEETPAFGEASPFAIFIRDDQDEIRSLVSETQQLATAVELGKRSIIAGCNGSVIYGAIYTDQLWVHPQYRQQGLARKLMERVHDYGRDMKCQMATVATMNFQKAQSFYEKLGYIADFERKGYVKGSSLIFLKKVL